MHEYLRRRRVLPNTPPRAYTLIRGRMRPLLHPLNIPDVLLYVVDHLVVDTGTPRDRWDRLIKAMLINKRARSILVHHASLWRWIDMGARHHARLFVERAKGRDVRPILVPPIHDMGVNNTIAYRGVMSTLAPYLQPPLCPEAIFFDDCSGGFQRLLKMRHCMGHLRVLTLHNLYQISYPSTSFIVQISYFPRLETLSVQDCVIRPSTLPCPALKHLSIARLYMTDHESCWADAFETFPNLDLLSLCGVVLHTTDNRPVSLPALRELRLSCMKLTPDCPTLSAPCLERAIFSIDARCDEVAVEKAITNFSLQRMVSLSPLCLCRWVAVKLD